MTGSEKGTGGARAVIRKARMGDVKTMHKMLMDCAGQGILLARSLSELYSRIRDFYVAADPVDNRVLGCCALAISWDDLAEIRSLVVAEPLRGMGFGAKLVESCLSEALTLGIYRVFTLTYQPGFFQKLGFVVVDKNELPQKVWTDCIRCPKFPECDETALELVM